MMWPFSKPTTDEITAGVHDALVELEDHVHRIQPMAAARMSRLHEIILAGAAHLTAADLLEVKTRLGVIGHQGALITGDERFRLFPQGWACMCNQCVASRR